MKILVSVFNNLYTDQRVEKVCKSLHENAYQIELIGNNWGGEPEMSRPYFFKRISLKSKILRFAYLEFQWKLYKELMKRANENSILLSNDLDALLPNYLVSKRKKIPMIWDSHEIFTEMPSVTNRWVQHIWRLLEKSIVPKLKYTMIANDSYADWFVKNYGIKRPVVVRNLPKKLPSPKLTDNNPKIILYQGAINFSRGIDKMIEAMQQKQQGTQGGKVLTVGQLMMLSPEFKARMQGQYDFSGGQNADLLNIKFADGTIGNYYFAINYVNGISLPLVYSSVRKANIDRNFMVKWLKNHDSKL